MPGKTGSDFNALVVDSNISRRMQIKSAATASGILGEVEIFKDFLSALEHLAGGVQKTAIFLSEEYPKDALTQFVADAKLTHGGRNAAFIINLKARNVNQASVATTLLGGFDGLLVEPFSVEAIEQIIQVAGKIHSERHRTSQTAAVKYLTGEILHVLDKVATNKAMEKPPGESSKEFKALAQSVASFEAEFREMYLETLLTESMQRTPPKELIQFYEKRAEAEKRAEERMARRLAEFALKSETTKKSQQRIIRR